jgi:hypothetical protein
LKSHGSHNSTKGQVLGTGFASNVALLGALACLILAHLVARPLNPLLALFTSDLRVLASFRGQAAVPLDIYDPLAIDMGLPCRRADSSDAVWISEDGLNLLERLARCLREQEEHVEEHANAEDAKD